MHTRLSGYNWVLLLASGALAEELYTDTFLRHLALVRLGRVVSFYELPSAGGGTPPYTVSSTLWSSPPFYSVSLPSCFNETRVPGTSLSAAMPLCSVSNLRGMLSAAMQQVSLPSVGLIGFLVPRSVISGSIPEAPLPCAWVRVNGVRKASAKAHVYYLGVSYKDETGNTTARIWRTQLRSY